MAIIKIVTHLGDLVVVLPLAMAEMLWLAYIGARRSIFYWALSLITCLLLTILLKVHFLSCPSRLFDLRSPSGHSSLAILVYGALATVGAKAVDGTRRFAVIGVTAGLILVIALSRFLLGAHTATEIVLGLMVGGVSLLPFIYIYRHMPPTRIAPLHLLAMLAILPFALTVESPDTEKILVRAADYLQHIVPMCGDMRAEPEDLAQ